MLICTSLYKSNPESLWHYTKILFGHWFYLDGPKHRNPRGPQHVTTEFRHVYPAWKSLCGLFVPLVTNHDSLPVHWSGCWMVHLHLSLGFGKTQINPSVPSRETRRMSLPAISSFTQSPGRVMSGNRVAPHKKVLLGVQAVVILGEKQYMEWLRDSIHYFLCAHGTTDESATVHAL